VPHGSTLWARPDAPLPEAALLRAERPKVERLGVMRRIVAAIRLCRRHARERQELHELSNHALKDVGLRREDVEYPFGWSLWYFD
jgi:uncharacterized protein YjiS (DUF1127 family)